MQNRYFDPTALKILSAPEDWRFFCSDDRPPAASRRCPTQRREWSRRNAHGHPHREYLLVLAGRSWHGAHKEIYPTAPGHAFFFDALEPHDTGVPPKSPALSHLWISLAGEDVLFFVYAVAHGREVPCRGGRHVLERSRLGISPEIVLDDAEELPPAWRRQKRLALLHMLVAKLAEQGFQPTDERTDSQRFQRRIVDSIARHIDRTAGKGLTLAGLARLAGYSKYHLLRLFKRHRSCTIHQYIDRARERRMEALIAEGLQHQEIAEVLGFSCPAAFSRWRSRRKKRKEA